MLLTQQNVIMYKTVNAYNMSLSYSREVEVYWKPQAIPKQKIMWAVAHNSGPCSIISLNYLRQMFGPIGLLVLGQLTSHFYDHLMLSLNGPITLRVVGTSTHFLHPK